MADQKRDAEFESARNILLNLDDVVSTEEWLKAYGLFMQAKEGDIDEPRPNIFEFDAKSKWDAWNEVKGTTKEEAQDQYIALAKSLNEKYAGQGKVST